MDFKLSDTYANLFTSMVFLWFLIFSIPTGLLMNKIGRKNTVVISLVLTFFALIVPFIDYNLTTILVSFTLIGIGNTLMQVSLNPLLSNIVSEDKLASKLTLGQFIKAIAAFIAPIIAAWSLIKFGDWKLLFGFYAIISLVCGVYLYLTKIPEQPIIGKATSFKDCFKLFEDKYILLLFVGILVHVGIDVGVNTTGPKLLIERCGLQLADAGYVTSIYFVFRTVGCFMGTFILSRFSSLKFFIISVIMLSIGVVGLYFSYSTLAIYICVSILGFGNSNVFSIIFSKALQQLPNRNNEISGLMITGIFGGALFIVAMGFTSDFMGGQIGAVVILTLCIAYLAFLVTRIKKFEKTESN